MNFNDFRIVSTSHIVDAYCKCGNEAKEVSNGWLSSALYCPKCEAVYEIKMVKVPSKKVTGEFLDQCRAEVANRRKP